MTALSLDLRKRIVDAYRQGRGTYQKVANLFGVGEATVSRLLRRERERADLTPDPIGGGYPPRINDGQLTELVALVSEQPDRTLDELCREWTHRHGEVVSRSSMDRALRRAGVTRKKSASDPQSSSAQMSKLRARRSSKKSQKST